jgi:transcriptional regulator with XRE-family HTH domain
MTDARSEWFELGRDFGHELQQLLEKRGISVNAFADQAHISRTYLADLIHGRRGQRGPTADMVARIAAELEVPPDHFRITRVRAVIAHPHAVDAVYKKIGAHK